MKMKLTLKQTELIEKYEQLEREYGKGNVFLRYVNDFWKIRFIIHKIGQTKYKPIYDYKINGKIINALEKKNLFIGCDNNHKEADPNSWRGQPEGWFFVGSQIRTELL